MKTKVYDVDYFIRKFMRIPKRNWCLYAYRSDAMRCALGHCGADNTFGLTEEAKALARILPSIANINDGFVIRYPQPDPRSRVLAALMDKKAVQQQQRRRK